METQRNFSRSETGLILSPLKCFRTNEAQRQKGTLDLYFQFVRTFVLFSRLKKKVEEIDDRIEVPGLRVKIQKM